MKKEAKLAISLASLAALVFGILKVTQLAKFAKLLTIQPKINGNLKNIKVSLTEVQIPLAVALGNRTDQTMKVGVNSVEVFYKGKSLAITNPTSASTTIQKYTTSTITGIDLILKTTSLISIAGSAINSIISGGKLDELMKDITLDVTCTYNNSIVFTISKIKIGDSREVNANTGAGTGVKGLGLTATSLRKIKSIRDYEMYIPPRTALKHRDLVLVPNGSVEDTVYLMQDVAKKYASDTTQLAKKLEKSTIPATLQSIFDFVYSYIQYIPDSRTTEQVRRPLRTLYDQKGDCDCYSVLIASMLENLNIPYKFRIAAYKGNYQHVYVIVPYNGKTLVCDPVLDKCFDEKKPTKHKDF